MPDIVGITTEANFYESESNNTATTNPTLGTVDIVIVVIYFIITLSVGLWVSTFVVITT